MEKDNLTGWALSNGWRMIAGFPSLTKPGSPNEAIVRLVYKATVVNLEIKKPAGKWEKISGASYADISLEPDSDMPTGLGFEKVPSFFKLMRDNKDQQVFANFGASRSD